MESNKEWVPILKMVNSPDNKHSVLTVIDWQGGIGDKPKTGQYVGSGGYVTNISDAVIVGPSVGFYTKFKKSYDKYLDKLFEK